MIARPRVLTLFILLSAEAASRRAADRSTDPARRSSTMLFVNFGYARRNVLQAFSVPE